VLGEPTISSLLTSRFKATIWAGHLAYELTKFAEGPVVTGAKDNPFKYYLSSCLSLNILLRIY